MNISNNILKHSLQNVYFLSGTAMAGKTTMAKELSKKYGFVHFNDNWHEASFKVWQSIINEKYQPRSSKGQQTTDWEAFFGRTVEEFLAAGDYNGYEEYLEYAIVELIKLSQNSKVVADVQLPAELLVELSDHNKIAYMLVDPKLVNCRTYGARDDHKEFLECILRLNEPERKIAVQDELFKIGIEKEFQNAKKHNFFNIVRTDESTIESTLKMLERHFGL